MVTLDRTPAIGLCLSFSSLQFLELEVNKTEQEWRDRLGRHCSFEYEKDQIDKGILPLVIMLRSDNFQTIGSCEGGVDSCSGCPYVQFLPDLGSTAEATFYRIDQWLLNKGLIDYEIQLWLKRNGFMDGIPTIIVLFPQFKLPPLHQGEFSHSRNGETQK